MTGISAAPNDGFKQRRFHRLRVQPKYVPSLKNIDQDADMSYNFTVENENQQPQPNNGYNKQASFENLEILELFVPMKMYINSAVSFSQWLPDSMTNLQIQYKRAIQLLAFIAQSGFASPDNYGLFMIEDVRQEPPHEDTRVGYRIRVYYQSLTSVGQLLSELFIANAKRFAATMQTTNNNPNEANSNNNNSNNGGNQNMKGQNYEKLPEYQKMTLYQYHQMVEILAGLDTGMAESSTDANVADQDSDFYPTKAFTIDKSLQIAANFEADEEQCLVSNYFDFHESDPYKRLGIKYPFVDRCYKICIGSFRPSTLQEFEFPFIDHEGEQQGGNKGRR